VSLHVDRRSAGAAIAGAATFLNLYNTQAVLPEIAGTFGVGVLHAGLTITAPLLAVACVAPFAGTISDRLGRKNLIVGAAMLLVLPTLAVAAAPNLEMMVFWRFVQGLLLPFIFTVCIAYVGDECPGAHGIRTAGAYSAGTIFGGFSGRIIVGVVAEYVGWRVGFVVIAACSAALAGIIALLLPRERRFEPLQGGMRGALASYVEHVRTPRLLATCLIGFCMLFTNVGGYTYVNFYLSAPPFRLGPSQLGFMFTVYLLGVFTTPAATRLAVRIGRRMTLALSVACTTLGLLLTLWQQLPPVLTGLALMSGGLFVVQALSLGFIATTTQHAKSTAVGLYVTVFYIGGSLGGLVPGSLWYHAGWPGVVALLIAVQAVIVGTAARFWRDARPG
jgi:predicted MFS family arabinose efflux permease